MARRWLRLLAVLAVVALFVLGGVRLLDSWQGPPAQQVDPSAEPSRLAYAALLQTATRNYEATVEFRAGGDVRRRSRIRVDNHRRRMVVRHRAAASVPAYVTVGTEYSSWARLAGDRGPLAWEQSFATWQPGGGYGDVQRVLRSDADVTVRSRNASAVVLAVEDTRTAWALRGVATPEDDWLREHEARANLTVVVDVTNETVRRTVFRSSRIDPDDPNATRERRVVERTYAEWGETTVRRPTWMPHTFEGTVQDFIEWSPPEVFY